MKKNKKNRKSVYNEKTFFTLAETLRAQADEKNNYDCEPIMAELNQSSLEGEYTRTIKLKVNQSTYIESLGLKVEETERVGYYKISW